MPSCIISPKGDLENWRKIVQNNDCVVGIDFVLHTSETWLPLVLSQTGFFPSNGEVKRNRPDLWRNVIQGEIIKLKWARIRIAKHSTMEQCAP